MTFSIWLQFLVSPYRSLCCHCAASDNKRDDDEEENINLMSLNKTVKKMNDNYLHAPMMMLRLNFIKRVRFESKPLIEN